MRSHDVHSFLRFLTAVCLGIGILSFTWEAVAGHTTVKGKTIGGVQAESSAVEEILSVAVKNVSNNEPSPNNRIQFPASFKVATALQYVEIAFQSNKLGASVIISTDNRRRAPDGKTLANPAYKSGPDGILGTSDDEPFKPETGVSGAGLVGTHKFGHGFAVPLLWTVFDAPISGGYAFTGDFAKEAAVLDKAQTHAFSGPGGKLQPEPFNSPNAQAYASIAVNLNRVNEENTALIASFPEDVDGPANGNLNGLRPAKSPIVLYMGVNYSGAPAQGYSTNTLSLEMVHQ